MRPARAGSCWPATSRPWAGIARWWPLPRSRAHQASGSRPTGAIALSSRASTQAGRSGAWARSLKRATRRHAACWWRSPTSTAIRPASPRHRQAPGATAQGRHRHRLAGADPAARAFPAPGRQAAAHQQGGGGHRPRADRLRLGHRARGHLARAAAKVIGPSSFIRQRMPAPHTHHRPQRERDPATDTQGNPRRRYWRATLRGDRRPQSAGSPATNT